MFRPHNVASKVLHCLLEQNKIIESVDLTDEDQAAIAEMESQAAKALLTASGDRFEQYSKVVNDYKVLFVKWIKSSRANLNSVVYLTTFSKLHIPKTEKPTLVSYVEFSNKLDKEYEEAEKRMDLAKKKYDEFLKKQKERQDLIAKTEPVVDQNSPFPDESFLKVHSPYTVHESIQPAIDDFCSKLHRQTKTEDLIKVLKWYKSEVYRFAKCFNGRMVKWVVEFPDETWFKRFIGLAQLCGVRFAHSSVIQWLSGREILLMAFIPVVSYLMYYAKHVKSDLRADWLRHVINSVEKDIDSKRESNFFHSLKVEAGRYIKNS
jgi:hypothetical protein